MSKRIDDDHELNSILRPLKEIKPTDLQMRRWSQKTFRSKRIVELSIAAAIGFLAAMLLFKSPHQETQKIAFDSSATIETIYFGNH